MDKQRWASAVLDESHGAAGPVDWTSVQMRRIGVFRARKFGDMLCATPVLRALAAAWPKARITLIGLPAAQGLAQRLASVDDFEPFLDWAQLACTPRAWQAAQRVFQRRMRSRRFDLVIQLHDPGETSNALVAGFGARRHAGFGGGEVWVPPLDRANFVDWPRQGTEVQRLLALAEHLGLPRRGHRLDMPLSPEDHARGKALLSGPGRYAVVHPGGRLASRRWSEKGFAAVADRLAQAGLQVVLTGSEAEVPLVASVAARMEHAPLDLSGRTDIWTLGALLASASVVVCNDTLVSLMADALGTGCVVLSSGGAERAAAMDAARYRVFVHDGASRPEAGLVARAALALADDGLA